MASPNSTSGSSMRTIGRPGVCAKSQCPPSRLLSGFRSLAPNGHCLEPGLTGDTTFCGPQAHGGYVLPVERLLAAAVLDTANLRATPRVASWASFLSTLLASIG